MPYNSATESRGKYSFIVNSTIMAAPGDRHITPTLAVVASVRTAQTAGGRWWSHAEASEAPQLERLLQKQIISTPINPRLTPIASRNARLINGEPQYCRERHRHVVAGGNWNDCSNQWNPVAPPPLAPPTYYDHQACASGAPTHQTPWTQCIWCHEHTEQQPWFVQIRNVVEVNLPQPILSQAALSAGAASNPERLVASINANRRVVNPASRQFITYLCDECEILEQWILQNRLTGNMTPATVPLVPNAALMRPYRQGQNERRDCFPYNTCVCMFMLEGPSGNRHCSRCRYKRGFDQHNRALIIRQQNDMWLRRLRRGKDGKAREAGAALIAARAASGVYRACRCGREVRPKVAPAVHEVFQCLGCEGILHRGPYRPPVGAGPGFAAPPVPAPQYKHTRQVTAAIDRANGGIVDFPLRRPWGT